MAIEEVERNKRIYKEKINGATYRELSLKYALSVDRIFKIVDREKLRLIYGKDWKNVKLSRKAFKDEE